ncbi:MAG: Mur ligase family protein, partial [Aeromicrobium sp.]
MSDGMRVRPRENPRWRLSELAAELGSTADGEATVTGISLNTGHVVPGDLYAALPGANAHGATYADAAREKGAVAVLTDAEGAALVTDLPVVVVEEPRRSLAGLAATFYGHPAAAFTTVGITGTQGKTTTTYLAEAALGDRVSAVVGTIGTRIGRTPAASTLTTPEAPQLQALFSVMREEAVELCAMEVSSHALVQGRVDGFRFDVSVFLNLGRDHLDFHHDLEEYFFAKAALFTPDHSGHAVINIDDAHGRRLRELTPLPVTTFSTDGNP